MDLPDPATYCPGFGYDLPVDPNILQPDPTWYPTGDPVADEIILTCSDGGDRRIAFYTTIDTGGSSLVQVFGVGGILIDSQTKSTNATYSFRFPDGGGVAGIGQTTFKVRITSVTSGKHIIGFKTTTFPTANPIANWQILYAKFNTPNITSLTNAFAGIDALQGIQFYSSLNSLNLADKICYNCTALKSIEFPNLPACTTLNSTFYGCSFLTSCKFGTLPAVTSMASTFYQCVALPSQVFPSDMPNVTDMSSMMSGCTVLKSITLPLTMAKLNTLSNSFNYCISIAYIKMPASLPLLQQAQSTFYACKGLVSIDFCTSCPSLINCMNMCYGAMVLKSFTFPTTQSYLTNLSYTFGWRYSLVTLTLPINAPEVTTMLQICANCYVLTSCTLPVALTKVTTIYQAFEYCYELTTVIYPAIMDAVTTAYACHFYNNKMTNMTLPTSMNACTTIAQFCQASANTSLSVVVLPASMNALTLATAAFSGNIGITSITLPNALPVITDITSFCNSLLLSYISACTFPATQVAASSFIYERLINSFNFPTLRCSSLSIYGAPVLGNLVTSINIDWANSLWGANANPLSLQYLNLSAAEINRIFTALPTVTGKTVNVQYCTGAATCTPAIATAKGWTVLR